MTQANKNLVAVTVAQGNDLSAMLEPRFGRSPRFLIIDAERAEVVEVVDNTATTAAHGAGIAAARLVAERASAVISGRFGPKAEQALEGLGVERWCASEGQTVAQVLAGFQAGQLKRG